MAFDLIVEPNTQRGRRASGVAFAARQIRPNGFVGVNLIINDDVARVLGWSPGTQLQLQLGRGRDFGWARLRARPDGRFSCRRVAAARSRQLLVALTLLGDSLRHPIAKAEHRITDDALFVRLPDWALPAARGLLTEARRRQPAPAPSTAAVAAA